jgi:hypothetical protein
LLRLLQLLRLSRPAGRRSRRNIFLRTLLQC